MLTKDTALKLELYALRVLPLADGSELNVDRIDIIHAELARLARRLNMDGLSEPASGDELVPLWRCLRALCGAVAKLVISGDSPYASLRTEIVLVTTLMDALQQLLDTPSGDPLGARKRFVDAVNSVII